MNLSHTIKLLRLPYSLLLLPVFLFAATMSNSPDPEKLVYLFITFHIFIYPACFAFNSYMDKDKKSINGLKSPPSSNSFTLWTSFFLSVSGLLTAFLLHPYVCYLSLGYLLASGLYSWNLIRLKRNPLSGYLVVILFQGFYVYSIVYLFGQHVNFIDAIEQVNYFVPAIISSVFLGGIFPVTQAFKHYEDELRGDLTISRWLGIRGTFQLSALMSLAGTVIYALHYLNSSQSHLFYLFIIFSFPAVAYFIWWSLRVWDDTTQVNFRYTMIYQRTIAISMVLYFILVYFIRSTNELPF